VALRLGLGKLGTRNRNTEAEQETATAGWLPAFSVQLPVLPCCVLLVFRGRRHPEGATAGWLPAFFVQFPVLPCCMLLVLRSRSHEAGPVICMMDAEPT